MENIEKESSEQDNIMPLLGVTTSEAGTTSCETGSIEEATPPIPPPLPPPTEPLTPQDLATPAGFLRRAIAFMIDCFFIGFLYTILAFFGVLGVYLSKGEAASASSLMAPFLSIGFVLYIGYFTFFHARLGQTPGKRLIRIKVVDKNGNLLSHWTALLRSFAYLFSSMFFCAGFLIAIFGKKKRGLHDFLVGSYVYLAL